MALFTTKGIADCLNLTERRVRELRDEGVLTEERPGIFNLKTVVRQYVAYKTGGTKDDQSRLAAARADREETRGKIEKMKMEEAKGNLHRTEDIENGLKTAFANFKDRLEAIPTKYADTMAQLTDPATACARPSKRHWWNCLIPILPCKHPRGRLPKMSRKNKCRGCVWGTRLNEITAFCPFRQCVKKGGGGNGDDPHGTADAAAVRAGPGNAETAPEPDTEPVGG